MGLTILTCMGRLLADLQEDEKALADVHALLNCARDSFAGPPRRMLRPLPTAQFTSKAQLKHWFRLFIEDREAAGAERILRTAIAAGYAAEDVIELLLAGATDHYFLSTGHVVDFTNKAFELYAVMTGTAHYPTARPTPVRCWRRRSQRWCARWRWVFATRKMPTGRKRLNRRKRSLLCFPRY